MALEIRSCPTLKGKVAKRFVKNAEEAFKNKGTIDFTKQAEITNRILDKYYKRQENGE